MPRSRRLGEFLDQLIINEAQNAGSGLNYGGRDEALNMVAYSIPMTNWRRLPSASAVGHVQDFIAVEHAFAVKRNIVRLVRTGADTDQGALERKGPNAPVRPSICSRDRNRAWPLIRVTLLRVNWCSSTSTS